MDTRIFEPEHGDQAAPSDNTVPQKSLISKLVHTL